MRLIKALRSLQLMAEVEYNNPPVLEVVIDASIITTTTSKEENYSQSIQISNQTQPSILTRLHAGYFRISLSLATQALLWKILSERKSGKSPDICPALLCMLPSTAFLLLWCLALFTQTLLSLLYILKFLFHFHMVKTEFLHHVGLNYLYAPWISYLLLLQSAPKTVLNTVPNSVLCWVFSVPVVLLDIKIYGQWFTTEKRFLSIFANPTSQISVIANFVVARAAAQMGWKESAICMFSLGLAHYMVLFITLYQRLSGCSNFPCILRPTFFLFFAAPSIGSLTWYSISGAFDMTSKMLFFLSLFLFISLVI